MKKLRKIPCLPGWLAAVVFGLLVLIPTYPYVRLIPAVIAVVIVCYCLLTLLGRKKRKLARILGISLTAVLTVGVILVSVTGVLILRAGTTEPQTECAYIVVLGAQVKDSGPSASLRERIDKAFEYLNEHPDTVAIVSGGKGSDEPIAEAQCMFDELVRLGIDPERIWIEDQATSTWENLKFSLDIIEEKTGTRPDSIGLVSSEFHLFRASMQAKDRSIEVTGIPARTASFDRFLNYFIREIAGVWHYLILGGQYA